MPPQTPLLLVDNLFDTVVQYPAGSLGGSSARVGHDYFRVADYRRERTSWQAVSTITFNNVAVDVGVGVTRPIDYLFLDRGHNLWGKQIRIGFSNDGISYTQLWDMNVPAEGTLGGDPTSTTMCVTEEGALYSLFGPFAAHRWWAVYVVDSWSPIYTGVMLGSRTQFLGYSRTFDEDAGERTENTSTSTAGYRGTDRTYSWRTLELDLALIGATEYDGTMRYLRQRLFDQNSPFVAVMDYGTRPERAWMYQYDGKGWGFKKTRVYRGGIIRGREVGASIG